MFSLFKKKESGARIIDRIWMYEPNKLKAFASEWIKNNNTVFICWFEETYDRIKTQLAAEITAPVDLFLAREIMPAHITGKQVIMAEHYPLAEKEQELFKKLGVSTIVIMSALDEPLFLQFGSEKIIQLMKQLGMKEDDPVEHNMISKAIHNAQDKISKKISFDQAARSQKDWMERNLNAC